MSELLHFKISAALKDIIGKDLITDEYIAVFELVKNAYDAFASRVDIHFENINDPNAKIIIRDNGKGMNYQDLLNKWLFVAYSAKKEGTEDSDDYRNKINTNRPYAGAKGIGRFSCDRLGSTLYLESLKDEENAVIETLLTDWEKFESDLKQEFVDISILHESKEKSEYLSGHGTVLEISDLRSKWARKDFLKLKDSLAKLINPSNERGKDKFRIFLHVEEEVGQDQAETEYFNIVNGEIRNFIFETLGLKTTKIFASISEDGQELTTELTDGETLIYKITEENPFILLDNIEITIYYLNRAAKMNFTKKMGVPSVQYGHIFLYKNGFRIYPYGQPGEDPLAIDVRKAQGTRRFLGTRELIGQIEIFSKSPEFMETSSRGDGLKKTPSYEQLVVFFLDVLKRLEKYVVEVQQWGLSIEDANSLELKSRVSELLAKISGSSHIKEFEVQDNFLEIVEASQEESAETLIRNISKLAFETGNNELIEQSEKAVAKLENLKIARHQAELQAEAEAKRAEEATEQLKERISENLFLKSINTGEYEEIIALLHHIGIYAGTIDNNLKGILLRVQNEIVLTNEELHDIVRGISFETKKILNVVAFATKANFKLKSEETEINLPEYIREYIQNIIPTTTDRRLQISVRVDVRNEIIRKLKPIELNIVIDNLINNAKKAKADQLMVNILELADEMLQVEFVDNGVGIKEENISRIYDFGYTTTDGSGLGLYHVKNILKQIGANISVKNNLDRGVTFTILF